MRSLVGALAVLNGAVGLLLQLAAHWGTHGHWHPARFLPLSRMLG